MIRPYLNGIAFNPWWNAGGRGNLGDNAIDRRARQPTAFADQQRSLSWALAGGGGTLKAGSWFRL